MFDQTKYYDIKFKLACFQPDSGVYILFANLPIIKEQEYEIKRLTDARFKELESMLGAIGVGFVDLEKVVSIDKDMVLTNKELKEMMDDDQLDDDTKNAMLFDEVLARRDQIQAIASSSDPNKEKALQYHTREYMLAFNSFCKRFNKKQYVKPDKSSKKNVGSVHKRGNKGTRAQKHEVSSDGHPPVGQN